MKRILVIAGTDSSGGAGLEADQKVIAAHGCYAMTAQAALTAQNTRAVHAIHDVPSDFVKQQIDVCVDDIGVDVVKTGMLASASTISVVAEALKRHQISLSVIDPVMVATTGAVLLPENAVKTLCEELVPRAFIVTPNVMEARLMLQESGIKHEEVTGLEGLKSLAASVLTLGPKYVLLKGGHMPLNGDHSAATSEGERKTVINVLAGGGQEQFFEFPYQSSRNTHGTGCSLASAIACNLARGADIVEAVRESCRYVEAAIKTAPGLGHGSGPLNHFHSIQTLPFSPGRFIDFLLEHPAIVPTWQAYTNHVFVRQMGDGTLPLDKFKHYMIQDYLYLIHFARANSLAGYKSKTLDEIAGAAEIVTHIRRETDLHLAECAEFGLTLEEIETHEEGQACTAYSRYVLDIGQSEDWLALQISLLPCLLGYHLIAKRLDEEQRKRRPTNENHYRKWIDNYIAEDYVQAVEKGCALMEKHAMRQSPTRIEELVRIFRQATKMETGFWEMAFE